MKLWLIVKEMFTKKWQSANDITLHDYELNTHKLASDVVMPYDALCCKIIIAFYTIVIHIVFIML